jgi:nitrogen fixation NifU-like protein
VPIEPQFDDLFREIILDHYRSPKNRGSVAAATHRAHGLNPVCGDEVRLDLRLDGDAILDIAFEGQGCSISQATASLLTERLKGADVATARSVDQAFRAMMVEAAAPDPVLGDLEALQGVAKFPVRVKCAMLSWNVLEEALQQV